MRAFVLSGGGNRGALQIGALRALLQHGIQPDLIVGSSVGAINGLFLAVEPSLVQVERMAALWREAARRKVFTASLWQIVRHLLSGKDYLVEGAPLRQFIERHLPAQVRCFGDLRVPLFVTLAHVQTQTLYVCGSDRSAPVVEAVVASAAVPGFFPPVRYGGQLFVDGGVVSNLPLRVAVAKGAREIWALDLAFGTEPVAPRGALGMIGAAVRRLLYEDVLRELEWCARQPQITLHHLALSGFQEALLGDWAHTEAMLEAGERAARAYLAAPRPGVVHYPPAPDISALPKGPFGAEPFIEKIRADEPQAR